jgi:ABC-type transport system involved in multi-copper enzyme maturation permease subunit
MTQGWQSQILSIIRLELRKTFLARRGLWIYLLALAPVALFLVKSLVDMRLRSIGKQTMSFNEGNYVFAGVFQFFYIRLAIFFGCLGIFMNLFRGEMLDKSLHFYLLSPVRRDVLLVGKYLAGLSAAAVIFGVSVILQLIALYWEFDAHVVSHYLYQSHGLSHVFSYLLVTVLACIGYGGVFLGAGLLFKNPIIPAAFVLVWEAINPILPSLLKKFSVIYYLKSLCPVNVPTDPGMPPLMALLVSNAQPVSPYLAVIGLLALSILVLFISAKQVRRLEINYTSE